MKTRLRAARITFHHYKGHGLNRYRMTWRSYRFNLVTSPRQS